MAYSSLRGRDMSVEREVAKFLDKYLYTQPDFQKAERTDNVDSQYNGSDIIISIPSKNIVNAVVDEKAQTQYINKPLPTFAFELSFLSSSNNEMEGWFTDFTKSTEYYLLIWINKAKKDWDITVDDIEEIEYALVSRVAIQDYLRTKGYSVEQLQAKARLIRANGIRGQIDKGVNTNFWFYYSTHLAEKPVNIIIYKRLLLNIAIKSGIVRPTLQMNDTTPPKSGIRIVKTDWGGEYYMGRFKFESVEKKGNKELYVGYEDISVTYKLDEKDNIIFSKSTYITYHLHFGVEHYSDGSAIDIIMGENGKKEFLADLVDLYKFIYG